MSRGQYRYDFGDTTKLTPLVKMYTLGHSFMPPGIHAGGLRYHGMAPMVSLGAKLGIIEAVSFHQLDVSKGRIVCQDRGNHAARDLARDPGDDVKATRCREENKEECIVFNLSGHGICDLGSTTATLPENWRLRIPAGAIEPLWLNCP